MRRDRRKLKKKKDIINIILAIAILWSLIGIIIEIYGDNTIKEDSYESQRISMLQENQKEEETNTIAQEDKQTIKQYPKEKISKSYKGYPVCAKLEIPKISLEVNILSTYSKQALKISATKFWGVEPNQLGNFCVVGHNLKSAFYDIKKLEIADRLFLIDEIVGKVEYEIFKIEKVVPEDTNCLEPITLEKREITLITCTNDSKKRVIIKAKEIE